MTEQLSAPPATDDKPVPRFLATPPPMPKVPGKVGIVFLVALVALAAFNGGWPLLAVIGALVVIVSLHELGHFLTAKWAGMKVTEFFLGIGPRLWSVRRGETEYGIKLIPAVAYVRIVGMHNLEEVEEIDEPRSYRQQVFHKRLIVVCAGSAMHFLMAFIAIWGLLVFHGGSHGHVYAATDTTVSVTDVDPNTAASAAGIQTGDRITMIDGKTITDFDQLHETVAPNPGKQMQVTVIRDGNPVQLQVTPRVESGEGHLGVHLQTIYPPDEKVGAVAAIPRTFQDFGHISVQMVQGIGDVLSPSGIGHLFSLVADQSSDNQGPVVADPNAPNQTPTASPAPSQDDNRPVSIIGIAQIGSQLNGPEFVFFMFVIINIFFGLFNLLPLLPFDGGHAAIAIYEKVRTMRQGGQPYRADILKMLPVTYGVVGLLLVVGGSAMYLDIVSSVKLN